MMFSTGLSYTDMEVDAIMNLGDKDGDGEIDLEEFIELMTPAASVTLGKIRMDIKSIDEVKSLFKAIDVDGDGLQDILIGAYQQSSGEGGLGVPYVPRSAPAQVAGFLAYRRTN